jgi:hypothetical protein
MAAEADSPPYRADHALGSGKPLPGYVKGGTVIHRGAHERESERDVDRLAEPHHLYRPQPLVVVEGKNDVEFALGSPVEKRVGRKRSCYFDFAVATSSLIECGTYSFSLFGTEQPVFTGMRI